MNSLTINQLSRDKCWVCNYEKLTESEMKLLPYLCHWCSSSAERTDRLTIREFIEELTVEAEEHLKQGKVTSCENIDALCLAADIGELAAHHPYLKQFSNMFGLITVQVALERKYTPEKLLKVVVGKDVSVRWSRARRCIEFLTDVGLLEPGEGSYIYERFRPSELLLNLAASVEAVSKVEKELPPRIANCVAGYALLKGINLTIDWLQGGAQGTPKGIIKLYPQSESGKPLVPKLFTAPTMFLLGHLTKHDKFSENDVRAWLYSRAVRGRDVDLLVNWLARLMQSSTHRLVDPLYDGNFYHFNFNPLYVRMRERYRERRRGRNVT